MPTITLTPTTCTSSPGWYDLRYVGNTSGLRQIVFTIPNNETLGGAGINITGVTFHGYVRNSSSVTKRLRIGCKPSTSTAPNEWSVWDGQAVLDSAFAAADASGNGKYRYFNVSRTVSGTALERISGYMQAKFKRGDDLCVGIIQPDMSRSIQVNTDPDRWTVDVVYELLGNIPSANVSSVALNGSVKVTIQKVISGSSTTLRYKIGNTTLATYSIGTGTTHTYTVPESAGGYFKTTTTAQLTIEAETFVGGVSYGTVSTSVTLTLPSNATPTATCTPSRTWVSGVSSSAQIAAYVQGKSGFNFAMAGSGKYGATISSYELVIENKTYTTSGSSIKHSPISGSGTVAYKYTVTDSRGLSRTYSASATVLPWKKPSITTFEVERVTEDNALAIDGTCVRATLKAGVSSLKVGGVEKNSLKYYVRYRKAGTSTWTNCDTETLSAISVNKSVQLKKSGAIIDTFDDMSGYEFQVIVSDIYDSSQAGSGLATKEVWWDVDKDTGSMGFGGESVSGGTTPRYDFYGPIYARQGITGLTDYQSGEIATNGKWIDGKPVYRFCKMYSKFLTQDTATDIALGIDPIDTLIRFEVNIFNSEENAWRPASYPNNDVRGIYSHLLVTSTTAPTLRFIVGEWMGDATFDVMCVLEYTKA